MSAVPAALAYLRRFRRRLRALRPDLVHSNGIKSHLLLAAAPPAAPVVWHLHDFYGQRPILGRALRLAARRAAGGVAISRAVAADAAAVLGPLPVEVIPNAIDTARFAPGPGDGPALDRLAGLPPAPTGTVRVGLVATFASWKGHGVFLEAAARAGALPARFYVVGGPVYRTAGSQVSAAELRDRAETLGLTGRVGFVPFQADPAGVYRALDVVVHASTRPEPFGLTIAEAMACGRAAVVSRSGGAAELFTPDHDAIGTTPGDADELAAAVRRLATDAELRLRLGANARRTAERDFDADRLGRQVLALYRRVLG
jgi:glycosyltransferase involved in cell wall biosynthesis